jgi:HrpA-like RNA helicase
VYYPRRLITVRTRTNLLERKTSKTTRIFVVTTGIFLNMAANKNLTKQYPIVLLDELHERSTEIDTALALLKEFVRSDPLFRAVLMSATIDTKKYENYFNKCCVIESTGNTNYPVNEKFSENSLLNCKDFISGVVDETAKIISKHEIGSILVFLPGKPEIDKACALAKEKFGVTNKIVALHSGIPKEDIKKDLAPSTKRKVIFATNIAETSITLDNLVVVVDPGKEKGIRYQSGSSPALCTVTITKSSAKQRKGSFQVESFADSGKDELEELLLGIVTVSIPKRNTKLWMVREWLKF